MKQAVKKVLKQQEKLNKNNKFSIIDRKTGKLLYLLIKSKNPKNVLEIGTSIGYSGMWIASALKKGKLTTIERWKERAELAKRFFKKAKLNTILATSRQVRAYLSKNREKPKCAQLDKSSLGIKLIEGDALEIIPKLKTRFDAVFLDAKKAEYLKYLKKIKLNKKALIIADNTVSHKDKMKDFLSYANKKKAITLNIGKGITIFII